MPKTGVSLIYANETATVEFETPLKTIETDFGLFA